MGILRGIHAGAGEEHSLPVRFTVTWCTHVGVLSSGRAVSAAGLCCPKTCSCMMCHQSPCLLLMQQQQQQHQQWPHLLCLPEPSCPFCLFLCCFLALLPLPHEFLVIIGF